MKSHNFFFKRIFSFLFNEKNYHKIKSQKIILDVKRKVDYDDIDTLISKIIPKNSSIIDVGANMGQCTGRFSRALPCCKIYSLEPINENFIAINRMVTSLNLKNVQVYNIGISDKEGKCEISIPIINGVVVSTQASLESCPSYQNKGVKLRKEIITTERLGNFIKLKRIKKVGLIKIDTEGHDYKVLHSGKKEILNERPLIQMEGRWDSPELSWLYDNNYEPFKVIKQKLHNARKHVQLSGISILIPKELLPVITTYIST